MGVGAWQWMQLGAENWRLGEGGGSSVECEKLLSHRLANV